MTKEEICKKVREMCEAEGLDFFFAIPGGAEYRVSTDSCDDLRRFVVLNEKFQQED